VINAYDLDKISAIWMLCCNDSNPIITYRGVAYRLGWGIDTDAETEVKNLVKSRGELFSIVIDKNWLEDWKQWVINGKHWPQWIRDNQEEDIARSVIVNNLSQVDVFRCQLRTFSRKDPCTPEQIQLGLEHLDRLRKAVAESREESLRRWSSLVVPIAVPLMALVATIWVGLRSLELSRATSADTNNVSREVNQAQTLVKRLELAATMRANAYEKSLDDMRLASIAAVQGKADELQAKLDEIRFNYYRIEPLIATKGQRQELWKNLQDLEILCQELQADRTQSSAANQPATVKRLDDLRTKIHDQLFQYLYVTTPDEMSWHGLSWPRSAPPD
jgi:hypothetical protein